jgi:hypothetical protein
MFSVHTSPLEQPGTGDAGGMNVYIAEVARSLARRGREVEIFTRATTGACRPPSSSRPESPSAHPGRPLRGPVQERPAGPAVRLRRRGDARRRGPPGGLVRPRPLALLALRTGRLAGRRPVAHPPRPHHAHHGAGEECSHLAEGDTPEPPGREIGEAQVVEAADRLTANTADEADQLVRLYDADPRRVAVVPPGVDLAVFTPGDQGEAPASRSGYPPGACWSSSSAGSNRSRPRRPRQGRPPCWTGTPSGKPTTSSSASSAGRAAPAWPVPRAADLVAASASPASVRFVPPADRLDARRSGTAPPTSWRCRPTASRSGWSPSRRWPAAPRSSRPGRRPADRGG